MYLVFFIARILPVLFLFFHPENQPWRKGAAYKLMLLPVNHSRGSLFCVAKLPFPAVSSFWSTKKHFRSTSGIFPLRSKALPDIRQASFAFGSGPRSGTFPVSGSGHIEESKGTKMDNQGTESH
jgi:hypothetical protein